MKKVTYIERRFIDRYSCIDTECEFYSLSSFTNGGLTYFKTDRFNYRVVDTDKIISVKDA